MGSKKILNDFVREVRDYSGSHLIRVILFGSHARGEASAESDYDLLMVYDRVTEDIEDHVDNLASDILCDKGLLFSTFLIEEDALEEMKYEPFIINAQREGIPLWPTEVH